MREDSFKNYVLDQLASLGAVRARSMFGGHGLYFGPEFFGILGGCSRHRSTSSIHGVVHQRRLYFRTDVHTRPDYVARGMSPFQPNPRQTLTTYYEVPADVLDDTEILATWARVALSTHPDKRRK